MTDVKEVTVFEEGSVKITNLRAIFGTKTYAISNITSVNRRKRPPSNASIWWIIVGVLLSLIGLFSLREFWGSLVLGLAIIVAGAYSFYNSKTVYIVKIGSASGESNVLESHDQIYIKRIVEAMNEAIVRKG